MEQPSNLVPVAVAKARLLSGGEPEDQTQQVEMSESEEHRFVSVELDNVLNRLARTRLFGVTEAQRRTFDYACVLLRDLSRPLASQVLWRHEEGIEKDLRTLLHDEGSVLKVYLLADTVRARSRLDEILASYRSKPETRRLLRGMRLIFLPSDFDADSEAERLWMAGYLENCVSRDLLFGVLFGRLTPFEFHVFLNHGGPFGLKFAALDEVTGNGLYHMPTFKDRLGYKTTGPIREALTMLGATGLVRQVSGSNICVPTIKGRLLLDIARVLVFDIHFRGAWSDETLLILRHLGVDDIPDCAIPDASDRRIVGNILAVNLLHIYACAASFGRYLLHEDEVSEESIFYSEYDWRSFAQPEDLGGEDYAEWLADEESLLFTDG